MNGHEFSQLIYFAVIAIIAIAKMFSRGSRATTDTPPARPLTRTNPPPQDSETERQRRFREALGLPPDATAPPPVKPRTSVNPPPLQPIPPLGTPRRIYTGVPRRAATPPVVRTPPPAPVAPPAPIPVSWTPGPQPVLVAPAPAEPAAPLLPVRKTPAPAPPAAATPAPQPAASASDLLLSLRDPASIRKAIILREVLGLPKALQPTLIGAGTLWAGR
jgi:hypothetical protein